MGEAWVGCTSGALEGIQESGTTVEIPGELQELVSALVLPFYPDNCTARIPQRWRQRANLDVVPWDTGQGPEVGRRAHASKPLLCLSY